ncbi:MMPL family transporter [Saccharothrix sp. NRRL B-16348]|uniref:MMPL family transporter n=1 Tax=Saccharothrix sp. NRRL B-16348 TaxID=1415542 RepID=UPI001E5E4ABB|nr:MMPL family transporter [Saccharothrix sp. NRRL B-16348]
MIGLAALFVVAAGLFGATVTDKLSAGGYTPESAQSTQAERFLADNFQAGAPDLVLLVRTPDSVDDPDSSAAAGRLEDRLTAMNGVSSVQSYWNTGAPSLRSEDGRSALITAVFEGDEGDATRLAKDILPTVTGQQDGLEVQATGRAAVNIEDVEQANEDLARAEVIGGPITVLILLLTFGSLVAVGMPLVIAAVSVVGTLALLTALTSVLDVSVFAFNLTTALGFGLAVDYALFIVMRYREELAKGAEVEDALVTTLRTVGKAVLFSAVTVLLALSALFVFPVDFLRSLAATVMGVVVLAALAAVVVLPAVLAVVGRRIDRFNPLRKFTERRQARAAGKPGVWHRIATTVMKRPILIGGVTALLLLLLALPFAHARFGLFDERILPADSPPYAAAERIRADFDGAEISPITVALPGTGADGVEGYATEISRLPNVARVDTVSGSYTDGTQVAPPLEASAAFSKPAGTWLSVVSDVDPNSAESKDLVAAIRSAPAPSEALVGGQAAVLVDTNDALVSRLPLAGLIILVSTFLLLFLFTGSLLIPLKAIVLNLFSLTATFGAMVYIFQDGNLKWLVGEFTATGYLDMTATLLLFCLAFGLSMDYEVFLLSRIKEEYDLSGDNTHAVVAGLENTGRLFTAAALVFASVMVALATSGVSLVKLAGVGMALAVLMDATLIRGVLVPAFMRLLGRANWWAPAPLRRLHERIGMRG